METITAKHMPFTPCGKNPPCAVKLFSPTPDDTGAPYANTAPSRINATDRHDLQHRKRVFDYAVPFHARGVHGNQRAGKPDDPVNTATALTSVPTANTTADQYAYRTRNPASGPI
jgi:hypothetical protein